MRELNIIYRVPRQAVLAFSKFSDFTFEDERRGSDFTEKQERFNEKLGALFSFVEIISNKQVNPEKIYSSLDF